MTFHNGFETRKTIQAYDLRITTNIRKMELLIEKEETGLILENVRLKQCNPLSI